MKTFALAPLLALLEAAPQDDPAAAAERLYRSMQRQLLGSESLALRYTRQLHGSAERRILKYEGKLRIRRTPGPCPEPPPKAPAYEYSCRATGGRKETAGHTMPWVEPERYEAMLRGFSCAGIGGHEGEKRGLRGTKEAPPAATFSSFTMGEPEKIGGVETICVEFSLTTAAFEPRGSHKPGAAEAPWAGRARFHIDPVRLVPLRWSAELKRGDEACNFCENYEGIEVSGGAVETGADK